MTAGSIKINDVSKRFRLERDRPTSIKEAILYASRKRQRNDFWVLQDINMDIAPGEFIGLIGHNGSGKSTLLRLVANIHEATHGTIETQGRLAALLELGTGFHPDLTGRENVYLNGAILGLSRQHMNRLLDDIVEFSGVGEFFDEPVRVYSSGMYVRLGFAVAVQVQPEILLIDEVIAVGDEEFQRRCMTHMQTLRDKNTTIVLVSHDTDLVKDLSDRVAWLDHGHLKAFGPPTEVVNRYLGSIHP